MPQSVPDHVVFYIAPARLTREDIRSIVHEIDAKLALHEKIGVVTDVTRLESITPGAMLEDLKSELQYLGKWNRFPKLALVADEGFLKSLATTIAGWLPSVELRVFPPDQMAEAVAFATQAGATSDRAR
jgi:hypothetical protein